MGSRLPQSIRRTPLNLGAPATCLATQGIDDALAIVAPKDMLEFGSGQLDGILGGDVLSRDFTIDYKRHRFEWDGGTRRAEPVLIPSLRVGSVTWRDAIAVVVPRPAGYPQTIDGLMPLHRFASVSFRRTESAIIVRHR